ncbi:MAG TPA: transcription factor S [Thermoplasmata archaeon]|nr:transcription factor S [Thermoplasmata archaeon]
MAFCDECGSFMIFREGVLVCPRCGSGGGTSGGGAVVRTEVEERKQLVLDGETPLPKTRIRCPKCGHREAYWMIRQTRAADEPETRIYRCVKCSHTWREY